MTAKGSTGCTSTACSLINGTAVAESEVRRAERNNGGRGKGTSEGGIRKKAVTDAVLLLLLLLLTSMGRDDVCGHQLVSLQIQVERNFLNGGSSVIRRKSNICNPAKPASAPWN